MPDSEGTNLPFPYFPMRYSGSLSLGVESSVIAVFTYDRTALCHSDWAICDDGGRSNRMYCLELYGGEPIPLSLMMNDLVGDLKLLLCEEYGSNV